MAETTENTETTEMAENTENTENTEKSRKISILNGVVGPHTVYTSHPRTFPRW